MKIYQKYEFERGTGDWEKLYRFMDKNNFSPLDFLACICARFLREEEKSFSTTLSVGGQIFNVDIEKTKKW